VNGARVASSGSVINHFEISNYPNQQLLPDLAFNGQNYLAVWTDRRSEVGHIYYTRIAPSGTVLNAAGIKLSGRDSSDFYSNATVASNHNNYLVSWLGARYWGNILLFSLISNTGIISDTIPKQLSSDSLLLTADVSVSDGNNYIVVWTSEAPETIGMDLYFRRVSANGIILDSLPILIARSSSGIFEPEIAFGGGYYFVVWNSLDEVWGCRIRPDGTVLDLNGFRICADDGQQIDPAVASDGHRFLVTWTDGRSENYDIYAAFVDSAGNVGLEENLTMPAQNSLLLDISPIPFNNKIRIKCNYPSQNNFSLSIYDVRGKLVKSFINPYRNDIIWDGKDNQGYALPNGTYFCRLGSGSNAITKRIVKLK